MSKSDREEPTNPFVATSDRDSDEDSYHGLPTRPRGTRHGLLARFQRSTDAAIPALLGHPIGNDLSAMIAARELEYDDTGFFICALLVEHADAGFSSDRMQERSPDVPSVFVGAGEAGRYVSDPDDVEDDAMRSFLLKFNSSREHHSAWYGRLVFAQQHKDLNDQNLKSFFAQRKEKAIRRGDVRRVVDIIARQMDDLTQEDPIREALVTDDWMKYRTSAASTATLVKGMIDGTEGFITFPREWLMYVARALANPGNLSMTREIPQKMVVIAASFHQAIGNYPEGWFQGNAARRGPLVDVFHQYLGVFQRLSAIRRAIPDTTGILTVGDLAAALGEGLTMIRA